jgi:hypothetical protein
MSSSQGANATTLEAASTSDHYTYTNEYNRDASDWTRQIKERRKYVNYKSASTDNKNTEPVWIKYGNQFRLSYLYGKLKCPTCNGNAFLGTNAVVGGS